MSKQAIHCYEAGRLRAFKEGITFLMNQAGVDDTEVTITEGYTDDCDDCDGYYWLMIDSELLAEDNATYELTHHGLDFLYDGVEV